MFTQVTEGPWEIETRDLPIFMTTPGHLALFRLVGLSKRKIIEPSLTAFTGFPFALVFTCCREPSVQNANSANQKTTPSPLDAFRPE